MTNERETTVTGNRTGGYYVWTNDPVHIRAFDKRVESGQAVVRSRDAYSVDYWINSELYDPLKGFKRAKPVLSDGERQARAERLRIARKSA